MARVLFRIGLVRLIQSSNMNQIVRITVAALALALGLEAGTRLDEFARWNTPLGSTAASVGDIITIDDSGARGVPGAQYRQFAINSLGLRGPEITGRKPRILVLGASETFGLYEPAGKEYPRQLQDSLAAAGCDVDVLNAGLPGFSLPTLSVTYRNRLRSLGASIVVLYPTPVQYLEQDVPVFRPPTARRPEQPLASHLRVVRRLRDHVKLLLPDPVKTFLRRREISGQRKVAGEQWNAVPEDRLLAYRDDLAALLDTVVSSGSTPLFMTHANAFGTRAPTDTATLVAWAKFYPRASLGLLPQFEIAANAVARTVTQERKIPVSDVAELLDTPRQNGLFADFSHFTELGSANVAGLVARDLLATLGCPNVRMVPK